MGRKAISCFMKFENTAPVHNIASVYNYDVILWKYQTPVTILLNKTCEVDTEIEQSQSEYTQ